MRRFLVTTIAIALTVGACASDEATETTSTTSPDTTTTAPGNPTTTSTTTPPPGGGLDASCVSPEGFSVSYPEDWETNDGSVVADCTMFDPEAFMVQAGTDERVAAINIYLENVPYSTVSAEPDAAVEHSRESLTIDGREAVRVERETSEDLLFPAGTLITSYFIDVGGDRTLVADTIDLSHIDYDEASDVLDAMTQTLEIDADTIAAGNPVDEFSSPPIISSDYPATGDVSFLTDVRYETHTDFSRVVFEYEAGTPFSYSVEYVDEAIPASGQPLDVGGEAILSVTMTPASAVDLSGAEPVETYEGPDRIEGAASPISELVLVEDFESVLTWAIGLEREPDIAVDVLDDPFRLVIDIDHG